MKVVLSGGGTGGHITPLLATAEALKQQNSKIQLHYVGVNSQREQDLMANAGLKTHWITSGKYRRYSGRSWISRVLDVPTWAANVVDVFKLARGCWQSRRLLARIAPDAVFVKGGYVGLPVGLAASWLKIPLVIHESDVSPGLTNRILAGRASRIGTGLPTRYYARWQGRPLRHVGIPLRSRLLAANASTQTGPAQLLIVGGSSGARVINDAIIKLLPKLSQQYRILHVSGSRDHQLVSEARGQTPHQKTNYQLREFLSAQQLGNAIAKADIIISRAGMTAIAEFAAFAKPLIVVPIALSNHQQHNAKVLNNHQAATVLDELSLVDTLPGAIAQLLSSKSRRSEMGKNLQRLFPPDSARRLANLIIQSGERTPS